MPIRFIALTLLLVGCSETPPVNPTTTSQRRSCDVSLSIDAPGTGTVVLRGEFNTWSDEAAESEGDSWSVLARDLPPGDYAYEWVVNETAVAFDPASPTKWFEGKEYPSITVPDCHKTGWTVEDTERLDESTTIVFAMERSVTGSELAPEGVRVEVDGIEHAFEADEGRVTVTIPSVDGKTSVQIWGTDQSGKTPENDGFWLPIWTRPLPSWTDTSMYLIFTDRFRDSDQSGVKSSEVETIASYNGGDFDGVTEAITEGYFERLGVDVLWLSPIYENPSGGFAGGDGALYTGFHGYWPIDPLSSELNYGSDQALQRLIRTAHENRMRVLFDIVLNHVHVDHPYCTENPGWCAPTCVCGEENCDWEGPNGRTLDCQFAPYLPDLNYQNHELASRVLEDVLALMTKFDVDGLRIDAAKHMDHVIMRRLRMELDRLEALGAAPFYLVGETFTGDRGLIMDYISDYELHGQFDFPLYFAVRGAFVGDGSFRDLESSASSGDSTYGAAYTWMSPFLGNHDVSRMATDIAGNKLGKFENTPDLMAEGQDQVTQWDIINRMSMAFAFILTQPGVPLIYYGDEIGLAGGEDPDNRRMMPQELNANRRTLLSRVQSLSQARKTLSALRGPTRAELWLDDNFYVYARQNGDEVAIVAMNRGDQTRTETVSLPNSFGLSGSSLKAWGENESLDVIDGTLQIELDAWQYRILHTPITQ